MQEGGSALGRIVSSSSKQKTLKLGVLEGGVGRVEPGSLLVHRAQPRPNCTGSVILLPLPAPSTLLTMGSMAVGVRVASPVGAKKRFGL